MSGRLRSRRIILWPQSLDPMNHGFSSNLLLLLNTGVPVVFPRLGQRTVVEIVNGYRPVHLNLLSYTESKKETINFSNTGV